MNEWALKLLGVMGLSIWLMMPAIAEASQHVVVVLDDSGSMFETMRSAPGISKIQAAKSALGTVLNTLPTDAHLGVVVLNQGAGPQSWIVPLGPLDRARTRRAIAAIRADGGTPLGYFMKVAADALLAERKQSHYGTYSMLIVTDGEATDGELMQRYLPEIIARGIAVDVIGVDLPQDHSLATNAHSYRRADDPGQLQRAVEEVFAESRDGTGDAGESDFVVIAGLPDALASEALATLSRPSATAIGETPIVEDAEGADSEATNTATSEAPPVTQQAPGNTVESGFVGVFIGIACFVLTLAAMIIGVILVLKRILS